MDALFSSFSLVALGEIGDKTQLLTLALILRYRRPWPILAGIVFATLVNHGLSVSLGVWLSTAIPAMALHWLLALSFIALGLWMLIPDKDESLDKPPRFGPFVTALGLFFIAEIGDKTQLATVALAVQFPEAFWAVLVGTTLGMVAANVPVIWLGHKVTNPAIEIWAHRLSALAFIGFGLWVLL